MTETKPQSRSLVTVFVGGEPGSVGLAKSILDDAGIRYYVQGGMISDFWGWGRIGPLGYNCVTGPVRIFVAVPEADVARELLSDLNPISGKPVPLAVRYVAILALLWTLAAMIGAVRQMVRDLIIHCL
jgi:hypothetical protein